MGKKVFIMINTDMIKLLDSTNIIYYSWRQLTNQNINFKKCFIMIKIIKSSKSVLLL